MATTISIARCGILGYPPPICLLQTDKANNGSRWKAKTKADPSLRLKNGYGQDDSGWLAGVLPHPCAKNAHEWGTRMVAGPPAITQAGKTPFPCVGAVVDWFDAQPTTSQWSGATGTTSLGNTYQLAEGQVGPSGQAINKTINQNSTPWIWSVVEFNSSGTPSWSNISMFPTFSVYKSGVLQNTYPQSPAANFINQGGSYYMSPPKIQ